MNDKNADWVEIILIIIDFTKVKSRPRVLACASFWMIEKNCYVI